MSENVELVQALATLYESPEEIALLASGDLDLSAVDPDIEWDASRLTDMIPDLADVYRGPDGVRTYWRRWLDAWKDLEFKVEGLRDAGDDVVLLIRENAVVVGQQREARRGRPYVAPLAVTSPPAGSSCGWM